MTTPLIEEKRDEFKLSVEQALEIGQHRDGFLTCDNCHNLASAEVSFMVGWISCPPCTFGEADSMDDYDDPIPAELPSVEYINKVAISADQWEEAP